MSKFNATLQKPKAKTQNLAGGQAYKQSDKLALISLLLTSFVNDQFYRKVDQTLEELRNLLKKVEPEFAAKAAIYARDNFGMRSISHALAGELAPYLSGTEYGSKFYDKVIIRPDDMLEILAYYQENVGDKIPNSMKKGFAKSFDRFDDYQIAKWKN